jgi:hypothetical protein
VRVLVTRASAQQNVRPALLMRLGAVLMFLIACANVQPLLARAVTVRRSWRVCGLACREGSCEARIESLVLASREGSSA